MSCEDNPGYDPMDPRDAPEPEEPAKGTDDWMRLLRWQDAICESALAPEGAVLDPGEWEDEIEMARRLA